MDILIYTMANKDTGLGHFIRMQALAQELIEQGHSVTFASDRFSPVGEYVNVQSYDTSGWDRAYRGQDWTIVDLPYEPPAFCRDSRRLCIIDGVGHDNGANALVISQGPEGEYSAPEYLILRPELKRYQHGGAMGPDFVFGGSADPMGLIDTYARLYPGQRAYLMAPEWGSDKAPRQFLVQPTYSAVAMFQFMAVAERAVISLGMIAWELAYIGTPMYIFSRTERHLKTAQWFADSDLATFWGGVGLPKDRDILSFLGRPFSPTGPRPDLDGAKRVVRLLERPL